MTPARGWGKGTERPGQRSGAGLGERRRRAARLPAGSAGRGAGTGLRTPAGGMGPRSWSRCVYISARVTSAEERTALARLGSREARAGVRLRRKRVLGGSVSAGGCGRRRGWAASSGRDLGGSGRSGRREGWTAVSFPVGPHRRLVPSLASAAGWHDRLYSAVLLFSLSTPAPCCRLPLFPGGREAWLCSESVLNKTKTGSVTRTSSDRLLGPLLAELALRDRAPESRGGA